MANRTPHPATARPKGTTRKRAQPMKKHHNRRAVVPEVDAALGAWVTHQRAIRGLTRDQLGVHASITVDALRRVEIGETAWTLNQFLAVAKAFGLDPATILAALGLSKPAVRLEEAVLGDPRVSAEWVQILLTQIKVAVEASK